MAEFLERGEKQEYWDRCLLTHLGEIVERELANRREEDDEFAYDDEDDEDDEGRGRNAGPGSPKLA